MGRASSVAAANTTCDSARRSYFCETRVVGRCLDNGKFLRFEAAQLRLVRTRRDPECRAVGLELDRLAARQTTHEIREEPCRDGQRAFGVDPTRYPCRDADLEVRGGQLQP